MLVLQHHFPRYGSTGAGPTYVIFTQHEYLSIRIALLQAFMRFRTKKSGRFPDFLRKNTPDSVYLNVQQVAVAPKCPVGLVCEYLLCEDFSELNAFLIEAVHVP